MTSFAGRAGSVSRVGFASSAGLRAGSVGSAGSAGLRADSVGSAGSAGLVAGSAGLRADSVGSAGSAGSAGLRARPVTLAGEQIVPVLPPLAPLFPEGGLRRGSVVAVRAGVDGGATSLALAMGVAASQGGSWCAAVGLPALGLVAAAGLGMALERFALVPYPGSHWPDVTAALIDTVDLILFRPPRGVRSSQARRLAARARERGVVLVVNGSGWPETADLSLSVAPVAPSGWRGLGQGHGYLQSRPVEVTAIGRGAASRERRVPLWLPGDNGAMSARKPAISTSASAASASAPGADVAASAAG